jgi:type VI secretion system protein ImpK
MKGYVDNNRVIHGFQAFYYELLKQKEICLSRFFTNAEKSPDPTAEQLSDTDGNSSEIEGIIVAVQKKLINTLSNVCEIILSTSNLSSIKLECAKYIMTVLADEIFLNMKWNGAKFWRFSLLEKQLFQSEIAGENFFTLLDAFLAEPLTSGSEIAFLYLMALSLGFKGKYRETENGENYISWYKDKLYAVFHGKPSRLFYPGRSYMINACYEYTIMKENHLLVPDTHFWTMFIMGIIMTYIVISYIVWFGITDEVRDVLTTISDQIRRGPLV